MIKNKFSFFSLLMMLLFTFIGISWGIQQTEASENTVTSSGLNWGNAVALTKTSNSPKGAIRPSLAVSDDGSYIVVAFMKLTGAGDGEADPFYQYSANFGEDWQLAPIPIRESNDLSKFIAITIDDAKRGHSVWAENSKELWYGKETSPETYSVQFIHSITGVPTDFIGTPQVKTYGNNNVYIVWSQAEFGPTDIFFKRSIDGGTSFQSEINLSDFGGLSLLPDIAVDNSGHIHVVWRQFVSTGPGISEDRIRYSRSIDSGQSWSSPIDISGSISVAPDDVKFNQPSIFIQGSTIHVAFENRHAPQDQNAFHISCSNSCTSANNWSGNKVTTQDYSVKDADPAYLKPQMVMSGSCPIIMFSSIIGDPTSADERIRNSSGCEGWNNNPTISSVDDVMGTNIRGINPSAGTANGWYIYLAFERKNTAVSEDPSHIYVTRNIPALYLPVVLK